MVLEDLAQELLVCQHLVCSRVRCLEEGCEGVVSGGKHSDLVGDAFEDGRKPGGIHSSNKGRESRGTLSCLEQSRGPRGEDACVDTLVERPGTLLRSVSARGFSLIGSGFGFGSFLGDIRTATSSGSVILCSRIGRGTCSSSSGCGLFRGRFFSLNRSFFHVVRGLWLRGFAHLFHDGFRVELAGQLRGRFLSLFVVSLRWQVELCRHEVLVSQCSQHQDEGQHESVHVPPGHHVDGSTSVRSVHCKFLSSCNAMRCDANVVLGSRKVRP
mmetsp:Transcript_2503/g.5882  ORF Transcript_2503/g.5882 Transcript_2503/m.5882 type:complete len:270 (-) Transcript_2503:187-996(-)